MEDDISFEAGYSLLASFGASKFGRVFPHDLVYQELGEGGEVAYLDLREFLS